MKRNVGNLDREIRAVIGMYILSTGLLFGTWWGLLGLIPLATAVVGWCPPYALLGLSTCPVKAKK